MSFLTTNSQLFFLQSNCGDNFKDNFQNFLRFIPYWLGLITWVSFRCEFKKTLLPESNYEYIQFSKVTFLNKQ